MPTRAAERADADAGAGISVGPGFFCKRRLGIVGQVNLDRRVGEGLDRACGEQVSVVEILRISGLCTKRQAGEAGGGGQMASFHRQRHGHVTRADWPRREYVDYDIKIDVPAIAGRGQAISNLLIFSG